MSDTVVERLQAALAQLPIDSLRTPAADKVGAALVIIEPGRDGDATIVYTRRRDDLRSHPGQISFPGGRVDPGETVEQAAIREANEEVALDPGAIEVIGRLPAFYIPPSRFWIQAVAAHWVRPHELRAAEAEVAAVLHVPLSRLHDRDRWRTVRLSSAGWSWAWDLGDGHLLWGATAILTAVILGLLDPRWTAGAQPADYAHAEVRPWERERRVLDRLLAPRLPGIPELPADLVTAGIDDEPPALSPERIAAASAAVMEAVQKAAPTATRAVVLAGEGGTGDVGRAVAARLRAADLEVEVITPGSVPAEVPGADIVVDALIGTGLRGPLRGAALEVVLALRLRASVVVSVDVPSGLDPGTGMVGDAVSADVTVALEHVRPGLLLPGLAPFVGDLYVAPLNESEPTLHRVVDPDKGVTWRE